MKDAKFIRRRNVIKTIGNADTCASTMNYNSINIAKKASHHLQMKHDGALGRGSLVAK